MLEVEQFVEGVVEAGSGAGKQVREVREAGLAVFTRCGVALLLSQDATLYRDGRGDMQDHAGSDGGGSILPVALLRAVFSGANDHAGNVLRVAHIAGSEQTDLAQRVEAGGGLRFDRREFEAEVAGLGAKPAVLAQFSPLMS
jgi:hypothetical protein